ncbi:MAG: SpoIIE family protein phosphatase [Lachnospiraceae bacterium]|nr:SpoIIE family protein phosphatase [Lachnospiraceae bacterium]
MKKRKLTGTLTFVIVAGIILAILVMQLGAGAIGYLQFTWSLRSQYLSTANMVAVAASHTIDPDRLDGYLESRETDEEYENTMERLQNLVDASASYVIYAAKVDLEAKERIYVYNVVGAGYESSGYELGYTYGIKPEYLEDYQAFADHTDSGPSSVFLENEEIGHYVTTTVPLYYDSGELAGICGVVMPMTELSAARRNYLFNLACLGLALSLTVGLAWYFFMHRRLVLPIRQITEETRRFSESGTEPYLPLADRITSHSEISELAGQIDRMERKIVSHVDALLRLTAEKNRLRTELNIAEKIQEGNLPRIREDFPGRREMSLSAVMKPAREVGGDFYDFYFIDEDHFALIIADVSGKGIPAALFMMVSRILIKTECMTGCLNPGTILTNVNQKLCENNEIDMFVSVWLGILELSTGTVTASNAGHEYPLLGGSCGPVQILKDKHGLVLGAMTGIKETSYSFTMKPGDTLFLLTDGIPEAVNSRREQFGMERLQQTVSSCCSEAPAAIIDRVLDAVDAFTGEEEQFDDTTALCVKYHGSPV